MANGSMMAHWWCSARTCSEVGNLPGDISEAEMYKVGVPCIAKLPPSLSLRLGHESCKQLHGNMWRWQAFGQFGSVDEVNILPARSRTDHEKQGCLGP